jgi:hypothetical protein
VLPSIKVLQDARPTARVVRQRLALICLVICSTIITSTRRLNDVDRSLVTLNRYDDRDRRKLCRDELATVRSLSRAERRSQDDCAYDRKSRTQAWSVCGQTTKS